MKVKVMYFARYRELLGVDAERLEGDFKVLDDVRQTLVGKGGHYAVLAEQNLMCARNEELCRLDEPLDEGDEIAFFPPVTGG
ncbi:MULTISPECIES: molybdopterin converting factor subunit 1 [Pseudomonas]|uniref:Molybdopterin synthase sulfur carrier subunit n=1 Tax=Pseudomonas mosselii TaxID=78327 RepID=A0A135NKB2_9PSED|nr:MULTISPECIES: molybdopterin converting factor subunit 1 [Pseudomonas]AMK32771.1 Molybdenum cofactor biosynthesis protein MoaD [Pseudomonas putida]KXG79623.1 molybdopterin synthase sulfur carrier subunit [Pseudomonas mosselii]MBA6064090.1 molybdopterin converting factor subunit 1 [Pseudomonas mosselii]MBC3450017.1 molybdopterin converting factor subunit 1 [Pseudomonas mosselii]MBH3310827.1 molybdopterin converting factor subunit 1 [Pseudomonas mosselii]